MEGRAGVCAEEAPHEGPLSPVVIDRLRLDLSSLLLKTVPEGCHLRKQSTRHPEQNGPWAITSDNPTLLPASIHSSFFLECRLQS